MEVNFQAGLDASPEPTQDDERTQALSDTRLRRGLSARQVQMIAIGGTIGTGLFLGTGRSLAEGGPASMLICYAIIGFVVYVTLLLLGEMATQYPVAGSFTTYVTRFFSPAYGFAASWNYWFNDAISVATDLTAAQLTIQFWTTWHPWAVSVIVWAFLVSTNAFHVRAYGEFQYWLSFLKVVTIVIFIIVGVLVNTGVNTDHTFIGLHNWIIPGAPFVGGFGGFARVFVTASFAYGGTESLGITAGETKNPSRNMPKVVNFVFWRILMFYILTVLVIGLNVPWDYPNLSDATTTTSPFLIVFKHAGSPIAASFMNTVVLTAILSSGNHSIFAGTRILYSLSVNKSRRQAPRIFSKINAAGIPIYALMATSSVSIFCFWSSYIGSGLFLGWLQNLVGVSNQIAWLSIGLASLRFRKAWIQQGRPLEELKFHVRWTWPWGPYFVIMFSSVLILFQGWSSMFPRFSTVDFLSLYLEIPAMVIMYIAYIVAHETTSSFVGWMDSPKVSTLNISSGSATESTPLFTVARGRRSTWETMNDIVDIHTVDLYKDEYIEVAEDELDDAKHEARMAGPYRIFWRLFYFLV